VSRGADPPVLVVGAGPVGLVLACELARRDVSVRIVDKLAVPADESRAIVVHARSLEMFARVGMLDELIDSGVKTTAFEMYDEASGSHGLRSTRSTVRSRAP
jgi:2-polyprenyl-6-methoxyphenol hydroxylase-like FAD-dependent oxidoreductase